MQAETTKQTIIRAANQLAEDEMKAGIPSRDGRFLTARQMALKSHWLSVDAMTANAGDGGVWKWSDRFALWLCVKGAR